METIKESLKENIKRLAMRNLEKEPALIHEKQKLAQLHEELGKVREEYKNIRAQYGKYTTKLKKYCFFFMIDDQTGETNPEMIWILLQTAASDLERATEVREIFRFYLI